MVVQKLPRGVPASERQTEPTARHGLKRRRNPGAHKHRYLSLTGEFRLALPLALTKDVDSLSYLTAIGAGTLRLFNTAIVRQTDVSGTGMAVVFWKEVN
jgi:hypothetical protein